MLDFNVRNHNLSRTYRLSTRTFSKPIKDLFSQEEYFLKFQRPQPKVLVIGRTLHWLGLTSLNIWIALPPSHLLQINSQSFVTNHSSSKLVKRLTQHRRIIHLLPQSIFCSLATFYSKLYSIRQRQPCSVFELQKISFFLYFQCY